MNRDTRSARLNVALLADDFWARLIATSIFPEAPYLSLNPPKAFRLPVTLKLRKTFDTKQVQSREAQHLIKKPIQKGRRLDLLVVRLILLRAFPGTYAVRSIRYDFD